MGETPLKPEDRNVIELDVRPMLTAKIEPFSAIMKKVYSLHPNDLFVLHATFKPTQLFNVLSRKGFKHEAERVGKRHWKVTFWRERPGVASHSPAAATDVTRYGRSTPRTHFLDNRGLEPPQPMIRTLRKLEKIGDGETLVIHNDRRPLFLYPELDELGYSLYSSHLTCFNSMMLSLTVSNFMNTLLNSFTGMDHHLPTVMIPC